MREILQQLATLGPGLAAGLKGNGNAMKEFMDAYQRTTAELEQQKRLQQQSDFQVEDRTRIAQERTDAATRQGRLDTQAAEDRRRRQALENVQIAPMLAEAGAAHDTPQGAESSIDALFQMLAPTFGGTESLAPVRDQAIGMAGRTITGRQKKQVEAYVEAALKTSFVADNPDSDPEMVQLPEHISKILGKPSARLSELQQFAQLPVGKPQGKTRIPAAAGSFEDYVEKKYGPNPTADQIVEARKVYNQADDRAPRVTVNTGGLNPYQDANFTERLAKTWNDANTSGREMRRQLGLMETGLKRFREGDKNGGSQAVLVTFQKILDPTSVVRESEYARSAAGISMLARIEGYADRLKSGGAGVPDTELEAMVETARQMLAGMQGHANTQRSRIEAQAAKHKIDPVLIFGVEAPADAASTAPPPAQRKSPEVGKTVRNKKTGEMVEVVGVRPDGSVIVKPVVKR